MKNSLETISDAFSELVIQEGERSSENLTRQYALAKRILQYVSSPGDVPERERFEKFYDQFPYELGDWLLQLPFDLASDGNVDEATEISRAFSSLFERENFLGDLAYILADAGRKDEALKQVEANLKEYPNDIWVVIKCGDALYSLEDKEGAEDLYREAYTMTSAPGYDRDGVMERFIPLLEEMGRGEEAGALIAEEEQDTESRPPLIKKVKVGRNAPCPCGSGKKYKKCCLRSDEEKTRGLKLVENWRDKIEPGDAGAVIYREIHHHGDWGEMLEYLEEHPDFWVVKPHDIKRLKKIERDFAIDLVERLLTDNDRDRIARERGKRAELLAALLLYENKGETKSEEDVVVEAVTRLKLWGEDAPDEISERLLASGDRAVSHLIDLATDDGYRFLYNPGHGEAPTIACRLLEQLKPKEAVVPLISLINEDGDFLREAAHGALEKIGEAAVAPLLSIVRDGGSFMEERVMAAAILEEIGHDERIFATAIELLHDEETFKHVDLPQAISGMLRTCQEKHVEQLLSDVLKREGLHLSDRREIEYLLKERRKPFS